MSYLESMAEVPVRALNQETAMVLARVKAGEEITLTERGTVIARIVPASPRPRGSGAVPLRTISGQGPTNFRP